LYYISPQGGSGREAYKIAFGSDRDKPNKMSELNRDPMDWVRPLTVAMETSGMRLPNRAEELHCQSSYECGEDRIVALNMFPFHSLFICNCTPLNHDIKMCR
jgi:hypothetical protein